MKCGKFLPFWLTLCSVLVASTFGSQPDVGKFWHVTDFHYDHTYKTSHLSCNAPVDDRAPLGDYWCDSPWKLVTKAIDAMATYNEEVDFVLWTGDTVAHISNDNLSTTINMDVLKNLTDAITTAFPDKLVFSAFGNHDYFPASQFPAVNNIIYNRTAHMWSHWIEDSVQLENFRKGGYYTRLLPRPANQKLRMVVLNTNLYYTSDKATPGIADPADQLQWLSSVLHKARDDGEKVIVAAHIPPGIHTPQGVQWYQDAFVQPVNTIIRDFADIIKVMHFGHDHYDGFKVFYDSQDRPVIPIFVAPSVTPWRFKLNASMIGRPHNPSVRLVSYNRTTGDHLNIQQFRLDLAAARNQQTVNFTLLYSFTEHYTLSDISATSLDRLVTRMTSDTEGDSLLDDYYRFALAGAADQDGCDRNCKNRILCGFRNYARAEYNKCMEDMSHSDLVG